MEGQTGQIIADITSYWQQFISNAKTKTNQNTNTCAHTHKDCFISIKFIPILYVYLYFICSVIRSHILQKFCQKNQIQIPFIMISKFQRLRLLLSWWELLMSFHCGVFITLSIPTLVCVKNSIGDINVYQYMFWISTMIKKYDQISPTL